MNKKLIAKVTAAACALSLLSFPVSVPGLEKVNAATTTTETASPSIVATGTVDMDETINVTVPNSSETFKMYAKSGRIAGSEGSITNLGNYAIEVYAKVYAKKSNTDSKIKLATKAIDPSKEVSAKQAYMAFQMSNDVDFTKEDEIGQVVFALGKDVKSKTALVTLGTTDDTKIGYYRIKGNLAPLTDKAKEKTDGDYGTKDGLEADITFSFAAK